MAQADYVRRTLVSIILVTSLATVSSAMAGPREMTTEDRLAILYAPQFNFTRDGEPLIHAGVLQDVTKAEFGSNGPIRVLPLGEGGPELRLNSARDFSVSISNGRPGRYRHWVVVQRLQYKHRKAKQEAVETWVKRGYLPKAFEVGGLFAIGGRRFDSRAVLIGVGGYPSPKEAAELGERLEARFGVETEIHSELLEYPGGTLKLSGGGLPGSLTHRDVIWVAPTKPGQVFTLKTATGENTYAGSLIFTAGRTGKLIVVNSVPAETLVKGVVPSEVYPSAPMESLKAQAIAARGEILSAVGVRHLADPYLLCSTVHCQVYGGIGREHRRTNKAVDATRGQLLFDHTGEEIVDARYSSSCGGHSENNQAVWGGDAIPYLQGHLDGGAPAKAFAHGINDDNIDAWLASPHRAYCNTDQYGGSKTYRWTRTVKPKTLQRYADRNLQIGPITGAEILERGVSGRVIKMRLRGERGQATLDRELAIRRAFGGLRSSMFVMKIEHGRGGAISAFSFRGGGFGHGVGMCQTGAMMMGKLGKNYREILSHYYRGSTIKKLY